MYKAVIEGDTQIYKLKKDTSVVQSLVYLALSKLLWECRSSSLWLSVIDE